MPFRHSIWRVGQKPESLRAGRLEGEALLEQMIVNEPAILSSEWMLIGRQEDTGSGGRVDLLALAPDGALVLIELKRDRTPREVVAQSLDYASWVEALTADDIARIYGRFAGGANLAGDFRQRFGSDLDEDQLGQSHQIVIVASSLDASTERIVGYLSRRGVSINVLCFQVFESSDGHLLSRVWLHDPVEAQVTADKGTAKEPWNGEYYASFGHSDARSWAEAVRYGFISAGGGTWYSGTLRSLRPGDRIWVLAPGYGYVGVGRVRQAAVPASEYRVPDDTGAEQPALDVLTGGHYHRHFADDPDRCEYFVSVDWIQTVNVDHAFREVGLFGNQNTVCAPKTPKWRHTIERLRQQFPAWDA